MKILAPQRAAHDAPARLPQPPLRVWLVAVMLAAAVPLALLLAYQLFGDMQAQQRRLDESLQRSAAALTAAVESELAVTADGLKQLSLRLQRSGGDPLPALREQALASPGRAIYLRGPDGQVRWHSEGRTPALPRLAHAAVSDLVDDAGQRGTVVEVPLITADGQGQWLGAWIDAGRWQRLVDGGGAADFIGLTIAGRDRRLIAHSGAGPAAQPDSAVAAAGHSPDVQRVALAQGGFAYSVARTSATSGWEVSARLAAAPIDDAQRRALLTALTTTTACLLLGVALATLLARHVADPLVELASHGPAALPAPPRVREIAQLRDALASAQEQEARSRGHLQRKADEFQALFAGTPAGLAYLPDAASGRVLHNAAMEALVGPHGADPSVQMFERGRALPPDEQPLQRAVASGREVGPVELELRGGDGAIRHVLVRAVPLLDREQHPSGAVAAMVDITERKQAEQRLFESDQRLRQSQDLIDLAQDAGGVGFFQFRFDTASGTWTPGQARLWGFDPARAPPAPAELLQRVHADDRARLLAQWRALLAAGRERETLEYRLAPGGGALPRWLSTRVMLAYDEARQPGQIVGVTLDVSEHKRAENERAILVAGEQAARQQAEAASRAKDEFLAMLGHELRNPLGAIASAVEVLDRVEAGAETAANARLIIGRQTRHLAHLMDDLLDVGRVISGKVLLSTQRVELAALVERVLADFEFTGASRQHDVKRALEPVWVEVDPTRLEQVVGNLLGNAFKHTPPGRRIEVLTCRRESRALLEVRDQGPGIAPDLLPRIFDLFVQSEQPLDRPGGGLGIGLTLVRRLVELHGGHVTARSSEQGTTFQVALPAVEAPSMVAAAAARPPPPPRRVLLVDDNADVLAALRSMLELDGHVVSTAADGERGLALLLDELPDAAIVDIGLPGLSGYEVAQRSRRAGYAGKLFALSGYGGTQDVAQARRHGFDAHLAKPVDPQRLQELVAQS